MSKPIYILVETEQGRILLPVDSSEIVSIQGRDVQTNITSMIVADVVHPRIVPTPLPATPRSRLD